MTPPSGILERKVQENIVFNPQIEFKPNEYPLPALIIDAKLYGA